MAQTSPEARVQQSWWASLIATLLAPLPVLLMVYLVETHTQGASILVCDGYPAGKVILCMLAAGFLSVVAVTTAIFPIYKGRWLPLVWVTFLGFAWVGFVQWYDWHGLFNTGKAWAGLEYAERGDGIGAVQLVETIKNRVSPWNDPCPVIRLTRSFESKIGLSVSPLGQHMVYAWYRSGSQQTGPSVVRLRIVDVDGHNDRELLTEHSDAIANQCYPCFSADGRQLMFAGGPLDPEGRPWLNLYNLNLCDVDIAGQASNVRQLPIFSTESVCPSWSPSGDRIAYMTESGELRSVSIENGEETTIARGIDTPDFGLQPLDWSPDGAWLCYVVYGDGCCELWKIRSNGGDRTCIFTDEFIGAASWSPDGQWLAFASSGGVSMIRPDGTGRRPVTGSKHSMAQDYCPTWSRDSTSIFCLSNRDGGADLYRADLVPPLATR